MRRSYINLFTELEGKIDDSLFYVNNILNFNVGQRHCFIDKNHKLVNIEDENTYYLNNFKYRNKRDFINGSPADILVMGCSMTFGFGIPEEYRWSNLIENKLNVKVDNLGINGAPIEEVFDSALLYIKNIGKPKYILALFPDFFRYKYVYDRHIHNDKGSDGLVHTYFGTKHFFTNVDFNSGDFFIKEKIISLPTEIENITSFHEQIKNYIKYISMLQHICEIADIKLIWASWYMLTEKLILFLKSNNSKVLNYDNFIELKSWSMIDECKDHYMDHKFWDKANDNQHPGIHWNIHMAESFIEKINQI